MRIGKLMAVIPLVVVAGLMQAPVGASDVPPYRSSANFELIGQIPGSGGTDLEFFSRELRLWKDWYGMTHTIPETEPPVTRHFAMVGNQSLAGPSGPMTGGAKIVDVTNPEIAFIVSAIRNCRVGQGDIQITRDGMVAAIAFQTTGNCQKEDGTTVPRGSAIVDLSDVYNPIVVGAAPEPSGSHNQTIHPSGDYLYISISSGSGRVPIFDISNPAAPVKVRDWNPGSGNNPHDIRFSDDGTRAYLAGISQFRIVNTADPRNPVLISSFTPPGSTIGHDVLVTPDKAFLFAGDELNGGGTAPCPGGAIYTYDIRNEASPTLIGIAEAGGGPGIGFQADTPFPTGGVGGCTSHVMDMNPDQKSLSIGWYVLGTRTFSWASLYNADGTPKTVPGVTLTWGTRTTGDGLVETGYMIPQGANTWSAKQYARVPGYIFSDDLNLGLYITKIKS